VDIMQTEGIRKAAPHSATLPKLPAKPRAPHALDGLDEATRATLLRWSTSDDNRRRTRAQIILLSTEGHAPDQVSERLGLATPTVYKWLRRFARDGLLGLSDLPRTGQPHRLPREKRAEILRVTRDELPPQGERWTIRVAARHLGVTQHQIRQVWSDAGLKPHDLRASPRSPVSGREQIEA
jgi:transposase